jgi:hypothetical protein
MKRRRLAIPTKYNINPSTGLKDLQTIIAVETGIRPTKLVRMYHGSPEKHFIKVFQIKFNRFLQVAYRKDSPHKLVIIKSFFSPDTTKKVSIL